MGTAVAFPVGLSWSCREIRSPRESALDRARRAKSVSPDYRDERYRRTASMKLKDLPRLGFEPTSLLKLKLKRRVALLWD